MTEFRMPSLGADMDEGTLLEWLVHPGDEVRRGDIVAVVDTAKAAVEVECFTDGVVDRLLVEPGTTVAVGTPLALIGAGQTQPPVPEPAPVPVAPERAAPAAVHVSPLPRHRAKVRTEQPGRADGTGQRQRVSPYARRLAKERGVDLSALSGTVRGRDVEAAAPTAGPAPSDVSPAAEVARPTPPPDDRMREAIARLMTRSKREIPHYYLRTTIDLQRGLDWMREHNLTLPVPERVVPAALLLAATARAAREVPQLNGYWVEDSLQPAPTVHLGVAVSLRAGGMVTPTIRDAHTLSLDELMAQLRDLVDRARRGRLRASELTDTTLTVTNLGDRGVEEVLGVIYPPQVALVGFGRVADRPWAVDGLLGVRPLVTATLSADHRATDGYVGARFLNRLDRFLQTPEEL